MRFLIVRVAALGDVALSTPLLSRIRAEHPDSHVTWLCGAGYRELVSLFPVDEVITVDEGRLLGSGVVLRAMELVRTWARLAGRRYDRVLILHPDPRYRWLALPLMGARVVSGRHGPSGNTNPVRGRFRGDEHARFLDDDPTCPRTTTYPMLDLRDRLPRGPMGPSNGRRRVALIPGGTRNVRRQDVRRRWPIASYRKLAEGLVTGGYETVLLGDRNDEDVARAFDGVAVTNMIGKTSITETLAVLRDVDVLVTHDTGPLHLARLVRTPMVALFGPTDPREFVGRDERTTVLWGGETLACRPCYDGREYAPCSDHVCMSGIAVRDVLAAVQQRLQSR